MAICAAPFRILSSTLLRSSSSAAPPCSPRSAIFGCPSLRRILKHELTPPRPSASSYAAGRVNCCAQLNTEATASAPFLTDHAKLIDSVETFIFDCDGAQCGSIRSSSRCRSNSLASTSTPKSEPVSHAWKASRALVVTRRRLVLLCVTSMLLGHLQSHPGSAVAEETGKKSEEGGTFVDGVLELLDPDQVTKSGRKLPKKYVKSVKEVVKSLRESFNQDSKDGAKFRRNADSAKEAIREYLQNWRGSKVVEDEDSYMALERAFRELGKFYSSKGPQAALPEDIRTRVLEDLNTADDSL